MNDFYGAASQVIPILLLAMVVEVPRAKLRWPRSTVVVVIIGAVIAEMLALGRLSFDEEEYRILNGLVAGAVWLAVLCLLVLLVDALISHTRGDERNDEDAA